MGLRILTHNSVRKDYPEYLSTHLPEGKRGEGAIKSAHRQNFSVWLEQVSKGSSGCQRGLAVPWGRVWARPGVASSCYLAENYCRGDFKCIGQCQFVGQSSKYRFMFLKDVGPAKLVSHCPTTSHSYFHMFIYFNSVKTVRHAKCSIEDRVHSTRQGWTRHPTLAGVPCPAKLIKTAGKLWCKVKDWFSKIFKWGNQWWNNIKHWTMTNPVCQ